jgi:hypothetical protein
LSVKNHYTNIDEIKSGETTDFKIIIELNDDYPTEIYNI